MKRILITAMLAMAGVAVNAAPDGNQAAKKAEKAEAKAEKKSEKAEAKAEKKAEKSSKEISLADARGRIARAIENPNVMTELMKGLSAEDQKQFLADVNKAISDMPGSVEEKTALFLNANSAAMRAADEGNLKTLVAEVFATVPPESLTVIAERFAIDLFNRDAGGAGKYTDEQFTQVATDTMKVVNQRTAETDNGSARSAFAIIMFIRASNSSIPELADALIDTMDHDDAKDMARKEWIPSALGKDGRTQGYEPLLASADAGRRPDPDFVLIIAGPQHLESVLADLIGKNTDQMSFIETRTPVLDAVDNKLIAQNAVLGGGPGQAGEVPNSPEENPDPAKPTPDDPDPVNPDEPKPYNGQ